ncbi:MAG TPA: sulfatase-like hydrolase/transferase [Myxococcota bacterium]|nr:sulfatase-like hydrolase/transferase [Myxococcota bacterium]
MTRRTRRRLLGVWTIAIGTVTASVCRGDGPCARIMEACRDAGFVQGGNKTGNGLHMDCIEPIMQETPQRARASRPLPDVDPHLVAACKEKNASFGQRRTSQSEGAQPSPTSAPPLTVLNGVKRSNVVFVLTDDLAWNLVQYMPHVLEMQKDGVTFADYFVTDSLCCPSRASIFTGRYPHDTGIFRNTGEDGGYLAFRTRGHEGATFATALSAAGYRTVMLGKYLNGYLPVKHAPAPGWKSWAVAGNGYPEFHYNLNESGRIVKFGDEPADYLTDVLSALAVRFIEQAAGTPFFIEVATFAPHAPYTPAPRDAGAFPDLRSPRTPAFNAAPDADAPAWLRRHPPSPMPTWQTSTGISASGPNPFSPSTR